MTPDTNTSRGDKVEQNSLSVYQHPKYIMIRQQKHYIVKSQQSDEAARFVDRHSQLNAKGRYVKYVISTDTLLTLNV